MWLNVFASRDPFQEGSTHIEHAVAQVALIEYPETICRIDSDAIHGRELARTVANSSNRSHVCIVALKEPNIS